MDKLIISISTGKRGQYKAGNDKDVVKKITTEEYFNIICGILKEKGLMPNVVKCFFATDNPVPMTTFNFQIVNNLQYCYGGICLELWHRHADDEGTEKITEFGSFHSLRQDREAMQVMGKLLADVLAENKWYINHHLDDFTWIGTDVYGVNEDGNRLYQYHMISSIEQAMQVKDELLNKYPIVILRDNATREETVYKKCGDDV